MNKWSYRIIIVAIAILGFGSFAFSQTINGTPKWQWTTGNYIVPINDATPSSTAYCLSSDCISDWSEVGGSGNPFDQWLDTTSSPQFNNLIVNNATGTNLYASSGLGLNSEYINSWSDLSSYISIAVGGITTTTPWTPGDLVSVVNDSVVTSIATSTLGLPTFSTLDNYLTLASWYSTTTDQLTEGAVNLYFTDSRVADYLNSSSTIQTYFSYADLAHSWGDHALAGYLLQADWEATTTDALAEGSNNLYYTQIRVWDDIWASSTLDTILTNSQTAYSWGDHSLAGYLTAETDPVWSAVADDYFTLADWYNTTTDGLAQGSVNLYDQTVILNEGANISISGTYPEFTISAIGGSGSINTTSPWAVGDLVQVVDDETITSIATSTLGLPTFSTLDSYLALVDWYATTTDGLDEGVANLYYTDNRVADYINASNTLPTTNYLWDFSDNTNATADTGIKFTDDAIGIDFSGDYTWTGTGTTTFSGNVSVLGDLETTNIYVTDTYYTNGIFSGYVTSTNGLFTQGDGHIGGNLTVDGNVTGANLNIANWDTAYGWGNHATAGYYLATDFNNDWDTRYNATTTLNGFTNNQTDWNTAFGWGDHSVAGYLLQSDWESTTTDALAEGSNNLYYQDDRVATYINSSTTIQTYFDNAITAFGWGNHATAGYLTGNLFNQWLDTTSTVEFANLTVGNATTTGSFWQGFGGGWGDISSRYLSLSDYSLGALGNVLLINNYGSSGGIVADGQLLGVEGGLTVLESTKASSNPQINIASYDVSSSFNLASLTFVTSTSQLSFESAGSYKFDSGVYASSTLQVEDEVRLYDYMLVDGGIQIATTTLPNTVWSVDGQDGFRPATFYNYVTGNFQSGLNVDTHQVGSDTSATAGFYSRLFVENASTTSNTIASAVRGEIILSANDGNNVSAIQGIVGANSGYSHSTYGGYFQNISTATTTYGVYVSNIENGDTNYSGYFDGGDFFISTGQTANDYSTFSNYEVPGGILVGTTFPLYTGYSDIYAAGNPLGKQELGFGVNRSIAIVESTDCDGVLECSNANINFFASDWADSAVIEYASTTDTLGFIDASIYTFNTDNNYNSARVGIATSTPWDGYELAVGGDIVTTGNAMVSGIMGVNTTTDSDFSLAVNGDTHFYGKNSFNVPESFIHTLESSGVDWGVYANGVNTGVLGTLNNNIADFAALAYYPVSPGNIRAGVFGTIQSATSTGTNIGLYSAASGGLNNFSAYFGDGDVYIENQFIVQGTATSTIEGNLDVAGNIEGGDVYVGDLHFENGWKITESEKLGREKSGLVIFDNNGEEIMEINKDTVKQLQEFEEYKTETEKRLTALEQGTTIVQEQVAEHETWIQRFIKFFTVRLTLPIKL